MARAWHLWGLLCLSPCDLQPAHSVCRSTSGGGNTPSLLPSTQPQCCRTWMMPSSSRSALGTMETNSTPPACRWPLPPSTAGQSLMVGEAEGTWVIIQTPKTKPCLHGNHTNPFRDFSLLLLVLSLILLLGGPLYPQIGVLQALSCPGPEPSPSTHGV